MTTRTQSRKRVRLGLLMCLGAAVQPVNSFLQPSLLPSAPTKPFGHTPPRPLAPLAATSDSASPTTPGASLTIRLSDEEQAERLNQTVELRRIQEIETKLALKTSSLRAPLLLVSQAAGYGEDIIALEEAMAKGHEAREELITRNMGLVHHCLKEILGKRQLQSLSREDLLQEGAIGLSRAIQRWDPKIGGKFSTYAVYWVRAAILRCIAERDDLVRVPEHVTAAIRKVTKAAQNIGVQIDGENLLSTVYSSEASWREAEKAKALAEAAGLSDRQLAEAMKVRRRRNQGSLSFEALIADGRDFSSTGTPEEDNSLMSADLGQMKKTLSRFLRPKEIEALSWRYGLNAEDADKPRARDYVAEAEEHLFGGSSQEEPSEDAVGGRWGEAMSFVEVGKRMKVSAEYGRRLCHAALEKLRRAADEGTLEPSFLF